MKQEIIAFLDFDGVISSPRAHLVNDTLDQDARWIDPISCLLIAKLQREFDFQIVISSTWRGFGFDRCASVLEPYGLHTSLHQDWKTCHWPDGSRQHEIDHWLEYHGEPPFIIFDDDAFAFTDRQREVWVQSCTYNGFQLHNYEEARRILTRLQKDC